MTDDYRKPYVIPPVLANALAPFRPEPVPGVQTGNADLVCERGTAVADAGKTTRPTAMDEYAMCLRHSITRLDDAIRAGRRAGIGPDDLQLLSDSIARAELAARLAGVSVRR